MKIQAFFTALLFLGFNLVLAQGSITLEAENATLSGEANIVNCNAASGGKIVRGIHQGGVANSLKFQDIEISESGIYFITLSYIYTSDRSFSYRLNDGPAKLHDILASGAWCFEGGNTAEFIFQDSFIAGNNNLLFYDAPIIDKIEISADTAARQPATFYISSSIGDDSNDGLSTETPWQSLSKINLIELEPGDSLLFKANDRFKGELTFFDESGTAERPIFVGRFGEGDKPILDGDGYLSTIHILNSGYIHFSNIEITNERSQAQTGEPTNLRYGMYFENTYSDGTVFEHFRLDNLTFKNIYPTDQITDDDQTGVHAYAINTSGSWGDEEHPDRFRDMTIENCFFTRTGRHATFFRAVNKLEIKNNLFEHVGGAGMVIGAHCSNILVEGNTTNYTGSSIDGRMAERGSGIWCFRTTNLTVQHNKFMHARGIKDSFGMHIDIGNRNVVYQYNYSENNEGGFVEILGANVNVGYRYNLSVGDGWRSRGSQLGRIFWVGGWSGDPSNPIGSDSVFIYNNSVFVPDSIQPRIWIEAVTLNTRIYNNIIYAPKGMEEVFIKNDPSWNDFDHNIWFGSIPTKDSDGEAYRGANAITSDPLFSEPTITDEAGFILQPESPAIGAGKLIQNSGGEYAFDYFLNNGAKDYFSNTISSTSQPNIGAYNGSGELVGSQEVIAQPFKLLPNPVQAGQTLVIEIPSHINVQQVSVQLTDITGRLLFEKVYQQQYEILFEMDESLRGCFLIHLSAGDYQMAERVLVF